MTKLISQFYSIIAIIYIVLNLDTVYCSINIQEIMESHQIVPDVIDVAPTATAQVI